MMGTARYTPILSMAIGERGTSAFTQSAGMDGAMNGIDSTPHSVDTREVDTNNKIVFAGLSDGTIEAFDLSTKLSVFHSPSTLAAAPLHSVAYSPTDSLLATTELYDAALFKRVTVLDVTEI